MKPARLILIAAPLLTLGMLGMTQPEGKPRPGDGGDPAAAEPDRQPPRGRLSFELTLDPAALRIRLERMISRGKEMAERGQAALDKLDAGAPASEVLNELRSVEPNRRGRDEPGSKGEDPRRAGPEGAPPEQGISDHRQIHAFLKSEFPALWANISPIVEQDPRSAARLVERMAPQIREILALQRSQPELAQIKTQQMRVRLDFVEASRLYRQTISDPKATDSDRADALDRIRVLAAKRFDVDLSAKQFEIDRLEARLDELRASLSSYEDRRDDEIQQMTAFEKRNAERLARQQALRRNQQEPGNQSADD